MTVQTSAGSTLRIQATPPATFDAAGYTAAFDASPSIAALIGEITDMGEFGREYALVTHNPLATRGTQKYKGSYNEGTMSLQLGLDNEDAGQLIAQEAVESDDDYYFEVTLQDGYRYFFPSKVFSFKVGVAGVDNITAATINLEVTTTKSGVGIVGPVAPTP